MAVATCEDRLLMRTGRPRTPLVIRVWRLIDTSAGAESCWPWLGTVNDHGYGLITEGGVGSKRLRAHRVAYESERGSIPEGLTLDHLCRNPRCCNPAHLEPVTQRVNVLRGASPCAVNAQRTHCRNGHPFVEANTKVTSAGKRACITCRARYERGRERRSTAA